MLLNLPSVGAARSLYAAGLFLLFALPVSAQRITVSGKVVPATEEGQKAGPYTVEFSGGQTVETNKKDAFSLVVEPTADNNLLGISGVQAGEASLKPVNLRDLQYIVLDKAASDQPLTVYVMTASAWAERRAGMEKVVLTHYALVMKRMLGEVRTMDVGVAREVMQIVQSSFPQYRPLLMTNLATTVPVRLSDAGRRAFALLLESTPDVPGAIQALQSATEPADRRLLAQLLTLDFRFDAAAATYEQLLAKTPADVGLLMEFKEMAIMSNQSERVVPALQQVLARVRGDDFQARNLNDLASVYHQQNDLARAAEVSERALLHLYALERQQPERYRMEVTAVLFNLGNVYQEMKVADSRALAIFDTVLARVQGRPGESSPPQLQTISFYANVFAGRIVARTQSALAAYPYYERMAAELQRSPQITRGLPKDQLFRDYLNYCEGREASGATPEEAVACYEKSVGLLGESFDRELRSVGSSMVYYKVAQLLQDKGQTEASLRYYQRALTALEQEQTTRTTELATRVLNCIAALLGDYGRDDEAEDHFRRALDKARQLAAQSPDESNRAIAQIQYNLALYHKRRQQADTALSAFERGQAALAALKGPTDADRALQANLYNQTGALWAELKNDPARAEADFRRAFEAYSTLADADPVAHSVDVAMCAVNLLNVQVDRLESADKKAALEVIEKTRTRLRTPGLNPDDVSTYQSSLESYRKIFSGELGPFERALLAIGPLQNQRKRITGNAGKSAVQRQIVARLDEALQAAPAEKQHESRTVLAQEAGNLAWYAIFDRQYAEAEAAARRALALDPTQTWVNSNLAHAILLQGRIAEAKAIYARWKDVKHTDNRPFRLIFLDDIEEMRKAGITHAGFEQVVEMLR